jgi:hypothetical protein
VKITCVKAGARIKGSRGALEFRFSSTEAPCAVLNIRGSILTYLSPADLGENDRAGQAIEQLLIQLPFESLTDRRLRDMLAFRACEELPS